MIQRTTCIHIGHRHEMFGSGSYNVHIIDLMNEDELEQTSLRVERYTLATMVMTLLRPVYNPTLIVGSENSLFDGESVLQPLRSLGDHSRRRLPTPRQGTRARRRLTTTSSAAFGDTVATHLEEQVGNLEQGEDGESEPQPDDPAHVGSQRRHLMNKP